jgi:hypothetical protein
LEILWGRRVIVYNAPYDRRVWDAAIRSLGARGSLAGELPGEGGPMRLAERWEPFAVVAAEEEVNAFVGVEAEELADDLHGQDFGVGELRSGPATSDASPLEMVVHEAEDGHDEGAKLQEKTSFTPVGLVATERRGVFSFAQVLKETCSRG